MGMPPFHLAFAVRDLNATRYFYVNRLGCKVGRTDEKWIDFNFFGHQISAHLKPEETQRVETNGEAPTMFCPSHRQRAWLELNKAGTRRKHEKAGTQRNLI